jgi:hypothetical protein
LSGSDSLGSARARTNGKSETSSLSSFKRSREARTRDGKGGTTVRVDLRGGDRVDGKVNIDGSDSRLNSSITEFVEVDSRSERASFRGFTSSNDSSRGRGIIQGRKLAFRVTKKDLDILGIISSGDDVVNSEDQSRSREGSRCNFREVSGLENVVAVEAGAVGKDSVGSKGKLRFGVCSEQEFSGNGGINEIVRTFLEGGDLNNDFSRVSATS